MARMARRTAWLHHAAAVRAAKTHAHRSRRLFVRFVSEVSLHTPTFYYRISVSNMIFSGKLLELSSEESSGTRPSFILICGWWPAFCASELKQVKSSEKGFIFENHIFLGGRLPGSYSAVLLTSAVPRPLDFCIIWNYLGYSSFLDPLPGEVVFVGLCLLAQTPRASATSNLALTKVG